MKSKEKKKQNKEYTLKELILASLTSILIGIIICFSIITILCGGKNLILLSKDLDKFIDSYETITTNYYSKLDKKDLIDGAISGMLANVDDNYTIYSNATVTEEFDDLVNGTYEGIGCTIKENSDSIEVVSVYKDSPAEKSGLKEKDIIITVDDKNALELGVTELSEYIKTKKDSKMKIVILRNKKELELELIRGIVETPSVASEIYEKNGKKIGYIDISIFASNTTQQFKEKLEALEKENITSLVIDVRGNNGGYLTTVVDITNMLLPKGEIIYQTEKNNKVESFKDKTDEKREYPIAVLINSGSASASEILAAAIKESYHGFVVGTQSFGKGTVQQVKKMKDGSMIKYTVENWLTPEGNWINKVGIAPTNEIKLSNKYVENPIPKNDNQLEEALNLVSK